VSDKLPSKDAIEQNAQQLAEYAVICQVILIFDSSTYLWEGSVMFAPDDIGSMQG